VDFARQRIGDLFRPGLEQQLRRLVGQLLGAEKARQRRQHDQEWEHGHQGGQRDVARDRPAVVGEKRVKRIQYDHIDVANLPHISPDGGDSLAATF
jgi:hypothetical protein